MRIAVVADLDANLVDGSTIWLKNIIRLLDAAAPDATIYLFSRERKNAKAPVLEDIAAIPSVTIIEPNAHSLTAETLVKAITEAERHFGSFDFIICRGFSFAAKLVTDISLVEKLIVIWTGLSEDILSGNNRLLPILAAKKVKIIAQTDVVKSALEVFGGVFSSCIAVTPPMVDVSALNSFERRHRSSRTFTISYSGKIDKDYLVLDLLKLAGTKLDNNRFVKVDCLAGKLTKHKDDKQFIETWRRARNAADSTFVSFSDNVPHGEAIDRMRRGDVAWCVRSAKYDASVEISTKMLEYAALGVPPIINRNPMNERIFGTDYPLFVRDAGDAIRAINQASRLRLHEREEIINRCCRTAEKFDISNSIKALRYLLNRDVQSLIPVASAPTKVIVAGHDLKFLDRILHRLRSVAGVELKIDRWKSSVAPTVDRTNFSPDAQVVFCEWCCENAVWFSNNKQPGTKLIVRLHRFEAFQNFPSRVNWNNVDTLIVVSDFFKDICIDRFNVPRDKIVVFPQFIETKELDRPKHKRAAATIGMVGINPFYHKRFDRAIDFFRSIVRKDDTVKLRVRSVMPWDLDWVWNNDQGDKQLFQKLFDKIQNDPVLTRNIIFDKPGSDMEEWYREVGFILSSSDSEGCHTSVMEGMASGCVPIVYNWPGARCLFPGEFVFDDLMSASGKVSSFIDKGVPDDVRDRMKSFISRYDADEFLRLFVTEIKSGDVLHVRCASQNGQIHSATQG